MEVHLIDHRSWKKDTGTYNRYATVEMSFEEARSLVAELKGIKAGLAVVPRLFEGLYELLYGERQEAESCER